jgi:AbrB family looped-hinge helix DNA binding protein
MKAKLSSKGQVTIPKSCRDQLGLQTGSVLDFEAVEGALIVRKVQAAEGSNSPPLRSRAQYWPASTLPFDLLGIARQD